MSTHTTEGALFLDMNDPARPLADLVHRRCSPKNFIHTFAVAHLMATFLIRKLPPNSNDEGRQLAGDDHAC